MQQKTKRLGIVSYSEDEIILFSQGLIGLPHLRRFILRTSRQTEPIRWLISLDEAVELPIIRPEPFFPNYRPKLPDLSAILGSGELSLFCILVLPRKLVKMTIDLRAPLLINPKTREGMQYAGAELNHQPAAKHAYRELFGNFQTGTTEKKPC